MSGWRARTFVGLLLVLGGSNFWGCGTSDTSQDDPASGSPRGRAAEVASLDADVATEPLFVDATEASGLDFVHFNGMSGDFTLAEEMGAGGALFDFDQDGDLDLYLVQGIMLGGKPLAEATFQPAHPQPLRDRLYRNDLEAGDAPRFVDVTASSGALGDGYGMGVAVGDVDNDGWPDLYITNDGANQLLRNRGVGDEGQHRGFEDVSVSSGTNDEEFSVPAVFMDYDRDGWLDLYVGNYVRVPATAPVCRLQSGSIDYCGPASYTPAADRLLRNRGADTKGAVTFEDVTSAAGLDAAPAPALGAAVLDANNDGWPDLYVANDDAANHLWINDGHGRFADTALLAGAAVDGDGRAQGSMGIVTDDLDADGDVDIFLTHRITETNTFYRNDGTGLFDDATHGSGLGPASRRFTAFGTGALDVDHDGLLDLLVVNGAVNTIEAQVVRGDLHPLHEPDQLFMGRRNAAGAVVFQDATEHAGAALAASRVGRGLALGDVDNDGDTDAVVINNAGPARLLLNQVGQRNAWLGMRLVAPGSPSGPPRDQPGARVALLDGDTRVTWRRVATDGSYVSAQDPRVRFGLGVPAVDAQGRHDVQVVWPDGQVEFFTELRTGVYHLLVRGDGSSVRSTS